MADDILSVALTLDNNQYLRAMKASDDATRRFGISQRALGQSSRATALGFQNVGNSVGFATAELDSAIPVVQELLAIFKAAAILGVGVAAGLAALGVQASKSAAEFEMLERALSVYTVTADETARVLRRLEEVAKMPGLGYREAVEASLSLQAVGMDARLAERAILSFGNALTAAGKGKAELDGVILALQQIASKGVIQAEEINQIAERVPQIRKVLVDAFGTARTEEIQKMGISAQAAIMKIIDELEKLDRVSGGAMTAFENIADTIDRAFIDVGKVINATVVPALTKVGDFVQNMQTGGWFKELAESAMGAAKSIQFVDTAIKALSQIQAKTGLQSLTGIFTFLAKSDGFGDGLVRGVSLIAATIENIPKVVLGITQVISQQMERIRGFMNTIIDIINRISSMITSGINVDGPGPLDFAVNGTGGVPPTIAHIRSTGGFDLSPLNGPISGIAGRAQEIYDKYKNAPKGPDVLGDPDKGSFRWGSEQAVQRGLLAQIADNTKAMREQIQDMLLGGGAATNAAFNQRNLNHWSGGGAPNRGIQLIVEGFGMLQAANQTSMARAGMIGRSRG